MRLKIAQTAMDALEQSLSSDLSERGCILGSSKTLTQIDHVCDIPGSQKKESYSPDMEILNRKIAEWRGIGICFAGFVHTHIGGCAAFSAADAHAAKEWFLASGLPLLWFGVAASKPNGLSFRFYAVKEKKGTIVISPMMETKNHIGYRVWREI